MAFQVWEHHQNLHKIEVRMPSQDILDEAKAKADKAENEEMEFYFSSKNGIFISLERSGNSKFLSGRVEMVVSFDKARELADFIFETTENLV